MGLLTPVQALSEAQGEGAFAQALKVWKDDLAAFGKKLATVDGLAGVKDRLTGSWLEAPKGLPQGLKELTANVDAKPDQTATLDAQTFLTTAQLRLGDYRVAMKATQRRRVHGVPPRWPTTHTAWSWENKLNTLYEEVQEEFSNFYRAINEEDEAKFTAKLTPSEGKLDLDVNFYERGLFPPGAYHSEGHQDGMGVCLYLALMKRQFGDQFTFALLDDVVMSVDAGHRYQFCKLLKTYFPDTQFIITTHDRLWASQMKSAGLVTAKTSMTFHSWTVDTGPLVESSQEIWDEIAAALGKGKVEVAAAALRHHLEYVSRQLADELGATPQFRADGDYELGDLLPSVLARMKSLFSKAADAAQSWGKESERGAAVKRKAALSASAGASGVEQWAVNKAVHYNEWANFGKKDFEPVVTSFRKLLDCFRCDTCESSVHVMPRGAPESVRCICGEFNLNLKPKPK